MIVIRGGSWIIHVEGGRQEQDCKKSKKNLVPHGGGWGGGGRWDSAHWLSLRIKTLEVI